MSVDRREVERIARLAGLRVGADEAEALAADLDAILADFDRIREVARPAPGEPEDPRALGLADLREDRPAPDPLGLPLEELAPGWREGLFVLPRLPAIDPDAPPDPQPEDR